MITVYRKGSDFHICNDSEHIEVVPVEKFFNDRFAEYAGKGTRVYIYDLKFYGLAFIDRLYNLELRDLTEVKLVDPSTKIEKGDFTYILSADNGSFYSITCNLHGKETKFLEFLNLVSVDIKDLQEEFGGEECVAMHRAIRELDTLGSRGNTISSLAYSVWKRGFDRSDFENYFNQVSPETEKLCRDAYHGGLCHLYKRSGAYHKVKVFDANSLYPYVMMNCRFPVGEEHHGYGEMPKGYMDMDHITYYIRFRCSFEVKEKHLPFVRTRCDKRHWQLELLEDSKYRTAEGDFEWVPAPGEQSCDRWGEVFDDVAPITVELAMYKPEFELFLEHYDVWNLEFLEYSWFYTSPYPFKNYVTHWYEIKKNAKTKAEKRIAKMMLNALTGRMAFKKERESLYFMSDCTKLIESFGTFDQRKLGAKGKYTDHTPLEFISDYAQGSIHVTSQSASHIQIGAAITSEAMVYMLRIAQKNYDRFVYTDTDSLHLCDCNGIEDTVGIELGDELGQFKIEKEGTWGIYFKEKIYHMIDKKNKKIDVTHAGLPYECQKLLESYEEFMYFGLETWSAIQVIEECGIELSEKDVEAFEHDIDSVWMGKRRRGVRIPRYVDYIKNYNKMEIGKKKEVYKVDLDW